MPQTSALRRPAAVALALALSLGLVGCGGGSTPPAVTVTNVNITLDKNTLTPGEQTQAHVTVTGAVNTPVPSQVVTWTSSNEGVATVDANGRITARAAGTTTIRATSTVAGYTTVFGETTITVVPAGAAYPTQRFSFRPAVSNATTPTSPEAYVPDNGLAYEAARGYGWVTEDTARGAAPVPVDASLNTRDRRTDLGATTTVEERQYTLIHLQCGNICTLPHITASVAWQERVANGTYNVTVGVGDANQGTFDSGPSRHTVNVEGVTLIDKFSPTATNPFREATGRVTVSDGLLTVDAIGGTNTKLNYVMVTRLN